MVLGECRKHYRKAQDFYAARYPDRQQKLHMAFKRLDNRICRLGIVKETWVKRRTIFNVNNAAAILDFTALNPHASSRQMEKQSGQSAICIENLTSTQVYANFLQNMLPQLMKDVTLHVRMNMWMQHDGALPHYALCWRQVMNEIFDEKWIRRGGPVSCAYLADILLSRDTRAACLILFVEKIIGTCALKKDWKEQPNCSYHFHRQIFTFEKITCLNNQWNWNLTIRNSLEMKLSLLTFFCNAVISVQKRKNT